MNSRGTKDGKGVSKLRAGDMTVAQCLLCLQRALGPLLSTYSTCSASASALPQETMS